MLPEKSADFAVVDTAVAVDVTATAPAVAVVEEEPEPEHPEKMTEARMMQSTKDIIFLIYFFTSLNIALKSY